MNYLVDTSVWVDYIQGRTNKATDYLDDMLAMPMATGINYQIYLEILQGARNKEAFTRLQRYFSSQKFYGFADDIIGYESAAKLYFQCRLQGITIRSSIDCLIAQCAIENELRLLHQDRDFVRLQAVAPELEHTHFLDLP